jgi:hypothetical protein
MGSRLWIGGVVMGALVVGQVWAAEVNVSPGVDTLILERVTLPHMATRLTASAASRRLTC